MNEEGQGNRSPIARTREGARNRPRACKCCPIACVEGVALDGSELWWDPRETGRREDPQLLLIRHAKSTLGAMPTMPLGALMRDSGLTSTSNTGIQASTIHSEAHKCVRRLKTEGGARPPHVWCTNTDIYQSSA